MKSYQLLAPGRLEMREVPRPEPGPGEISVKIHAALTCGTDLKTYRRGHPKIPLPVPFGHEFSGTVAATGEGVTTFRPGEPIMAVHSAPCDQCFFCRNGQENLCTSIMETKVLGAFAEEILLPSHIVARNVYSKPDHLPFEAAAFLEPLACVVYGSRLQPLFPGSTVVILGAGPIGLLFLLLAQARGVARIVIGGRGRTRLNLARELGADRVMNVAEEDILSAVKATTAGRGADQVIDCTGLPEVWESTPHLVRKGGRILLFGGCPGGTRACFDTARLHYDQITLQGAFHFTPTAVTEARDLLVTERIDVRPLISGRFPLADLEKVLNLLSAGEGIKYALHP